MVRYLASVLLIRLVIYLRGKIELEYWKLGKDAVFLVG
jgi:hypothetical protein